MALDPAQLPDDIIALKVTLVRESTARAAAETQVQDRDAEIANLNLTIAKMQRDRFGSTSERGPLQTNIRTGPLSGD